jgi:hypothetical protein
MLAGILGTLLWIVVALIIIGLVMGFFFRGRVAR